MLVIVESPTKARTLQGFLGGDYTITSSFGHVRDLPEKELAIDIENDFKPKYVIMPKAKKNIAQLKKQVQKTPNIILATDEDREGEAIAYHLTHALNLKGPKRIVFHEITKRAIEQALKNPRNIDMNLVDAQQARRVLDRLVGYKLSPLLWKKVAKGLSAGRVQSVAVRLVVERQKEIDEFKPQEYWGVEAKLQQRIDTNHESFIARLVKKNAKAIPKLGIKTKKQTDEIIKDLKGAEYKVFDIKKKELQKNPFPPYTTSTLQQDANRRLRYSAKQTMLLAQKLYEKGLITYHRTDSLNLSKLFLDAAKKYISKEFGAKYLKIRQFKTKTKGAQEAHEAIRPTNLQQKADDKLYNLIWQRALASQMSSAVFDATSVDIKASKYEFRATGQTLKFDGFLKVYLIKIEQITLPKLKKDEILELIKLIPSQHFTQPPFPYTEATLVKTLEENGIGRPSTYASTLDTIQKRNYVVKKIRHLYPTDIGILVNNLLVEHFPKIVDIKFTAKMEKDLDEIAKGKEKWVLVIEKFYAPFEKNLKQKDKEIDKKEITEEKSEEICEKCNKPMIIKIGRYGKFLACSGFPKCKNTKNIEKSLGIACPKCIEGEIIERQTKKGKIFYGCNQFPKCDFALWNQPILEKCPKCDSLLVKTSTNKVKCSNKVCDFIKK
jgi:DNA topoisomerase-1